MLWVTKFDLEYAYKLTKHMLESLPFHHKWIDLNVLGEHKMQLHVGNLSTVHYYSALKISQTTTLQLSQPVASGFSSTWFSVLVAADMFACYSAFRNYSSYSITCMVWAHLQYIYIYMYVLTRTGCCMYIHLSSSYYHSYLGCILLTHHQYTTAVLCTTSGHIERT